MTGQARHLSYWGDSRPVYEFMPKRFLLVTNWRLILSLRWKICREMLTRRPKVPQEESVPPPPVKLSPLTGMGHIGLQPESDGRITTASKLIGKRPFNYRRLMT